MLAAEDAAKAAAAGPATEAAAAPPESPDPGADASGSPAPGGEMPPLLQQNFQRPGAKKKEIAL
jgi:hypothetical protein